MYGLEEIKAMNEERAAEGAAKRAAAKEKFKEELERAEPEE